VFKVNGVILDRSKPLELVCPKCLAAPGAQCTGVISRGAQVRQSNHLERWQDFLTLERDRGSKVEYTRTKAPGKPSRQAPQVQNAPKTKPVVRVEREPLPRHYDKYMASERWAKTCEAAFALTAERECRACKATAGVEMHHRTFERFMREYAQDLVPFCADCWAQVDALADDGMSVAAAMTKVCKRAPKPLVLVERSHTALLLNGKQVVKAQVIAVPCSECGAAAGAGCMGKLNGKRQALRRASLHEVRWEAFARAYPVTR
jgi:hypothetical protein